MDESNEAQIPAASIGDIDLNALAETNPQAAAEIARLSDRMDRGEESRDEFLNLCQLLFDVGAVADAEYLLRRNIEYYDGRALYGQLFGNKKQVEFNSAIEAFALQFELQLTPLRQLDFLVSTFLSKGGPARFDEFAVLSRECEIKFGYIERDKIELDVISRASGDDDAGLSMFFVDGVWEVVDV